MGKITVYVECIKDFRAAMIAGSFCVEGIDIVSSGKSDNNVSNWSTVIEKIEIRNSDNVYMCLVVTLNGDEE